MKVTLRETFHPARALDIDGRVCKVPAGMGRWGTTKVGLFALLATVGLLLAFLPTAALANGSANPITVNEQSNDEPLEAAGDSKAECISTAAGKGCTLRAAVELANYESREFIEVVTIDLPAETF